MMKKKIKVLNLYAGIGGNRKLWKDVEVTAIELNPKIAHIYKEFFPDDRVLVADAHKYLLEHFEEYDFIWSSRPCASHSRARYGLGVRGGKTKAKYPDLKLYEEIILWKMCYFKPWCVENVISYYPPMIPPVQLDNHYFWSNFSISYIKPQMDNLRTTNDKERRMEKDRKTRMYFDISMYKGINKLKTHRNCVNQKLGLHIFDCAFKLKQSKLIN